MTKRSKPIAPAATSSIDQSVAMFNEWKRGAPIHQLVKDFGPTSRSRVRATLTAAAGGKDKFQALRQAGAGGRAAEPKDTTPRERKARREHAPPPRIDDSNVPMVLSCRTSDGWTQQYRDTARTELIFTSPEGLSYVRAADTQPADLIHIGVPEGLPPIRLRRYERSGLEQKRAKADQAEIETKAHQAQQRAAKKAKREQRRARQQKTTRTVK